MCGLFGVISESSQINVEKCRRALETIFHRGPDDSGEVVFPNLYLGHRRLSILDLSSAGRQPMDDGKCLITVNGEIYNFPELRSELETDYRFISQSDSEVVLHGYQKWGWQGLLSRLDGMYAIALYDTGSKTLHLARDPAGIKPLYYAWNGRELVWASELKAIRDYLQLGEKDVDPESLFDFLTYRFIPSPKTLYRQVKKLPAATELTFRIGDLEPRHGAFWKPCFKYSVFASEEEVLERLDHLLRNTIRQQLLSDVPVGLFLSGGIDSALLLAIATDMGVGLPTFTISWDDKRYDESERARATADHLGASLFESKLDVATAQNTIQLMPQLFDEPFADFSAVPTFAVCKLAREGATVALSGDGADELFSGYRRYSMASELAKAVPVTGSFSRSYLAPLKTRLGWSRSGRLLRFLEEKLVRNPWDRYTLSQGGFLPAESRWVLRDWALSSDYQPYWLYADHWKPDAGPARALRYLEFNTFLPDALLAKVDRVSMAQSLEVRVPYLSRALVDFAFTLPEKYLSESHVTKPLLRSLARRYLPESVTQAPKKGFGLPPSARLGLDGKRHSVQYKVLQEQFGYGWKEG